MKNKWCILLTTCVNNFDEKEIYYRKCLYRQQILRWLNETELPIIVIESSGWTFPFIEPHPRLYIISFTITEKLLSSSHYEGASILYALNNLKNKNHPFYENSSHILKVTGRYFLQDLERQLENIESDKDLYLQIHRNNDIQWNNSEYFGIKKELFFEFIEFADFENKNQLIEHVLYEFSLLHSYQSFGTFPNNVQRGGDKLIIKDL
jgi:hypothetical protein